MRLDFFMVLMILSFSQIGMSDFPDSHQADPVIIAKDGKNIPQLLQKYIPAVARITFYPIGGIGTGFYVGHGLVLTAGHNLAAADTQPVELSSMELSLGADPQKLRRKFEPLKEYQGDPKKISLHFGLTGPDRYLDEGGTQPYTRDARGHLRDQFGRVMLEPNFQVEEVIDAKWAGEPTRDYALLRIKKPWPEVQFELATDKDATPEVGDSWISFGFWRGIDPFILTGGKILDNTGSFYGYSPPSGEIHSSSGGPIIHEKTGKVIGILSTTIGDLKFETPNHRLILAMRPTLAFERSQAKLCGEFLSELAK